MKLRELEERLRRILRDSKANQGSVEADLQDLIDDVERERLLDGAKETTR